MVSSMSARATWRIAAVIIALLLLHQLVQFRDSFSTARYDDEIPLDTSTSSGKIQASTPIASDCDSSLAGLKDIFVMLKTGANEALDKVPIHFTTDLRCVPNFAIYSDYEEEIEGHHVTDALADVSPSIIANHDDFKYYRRLQEKGRAAFSAEEVAAWANAGNSAAGRDTPGWKLDKWKFLPIAEKAYAAKPDAKWYILMEADTFIMWKAMLEWLSKLKSSKPYYIGQQMMIGDVIFAYGGAGFMLSNPAMEKVVKAHQYQLDSYDEYTSHHWAGDCVLGKALRDTGVDVTWAWPNLMGESPALMDWDSDFAGDKRLWCYYATTYHHLLPQDVGWLHNFETKWNAVNSTMRHKDVFRNYILPHIKPARAEWDNNSVDKVKDGSSFEDCRRACEIDAECMQFSVVGTTCNTDKIVKLGHEKPATPTEQATSGWMMDRVEDFMQRMDKSCRNADWILP